MPTCQHGGCARDACWAIWRDEAGNVARAWKMDAPKRTDLADFWTEGDGYHEPGDEAWHPVAAHERYCANHGRELVDADRQRRTVERDLAAHHVALE